MVEAEFSDYEGLLKWICRRWITRLSFLDSLITFEDVMSEAKVSFFELRNKYGRNADQKGFSTLLYLRVNQNFRWIEERLKKERRVVSENLWSDSQEDTPCSWEGFATKAIELPEELRTLVNVIWESPVEFLEAFGPRKPNFRKLKRYFKKTLGGSKKFHGIFQELVYNYKGGE